MLRKSHIIALALVAAAVAAPIAQAGKPADPLAVSMLLGKGYTAAQIAAMTGGSIPVSAPTPAVDPLAISYLQSMGLTPSEIADWTTGACSHEVKAASCYAVFEHGSTNVASASDGFAWGDAGIGAAATLGIVLLVMGLGFTLITRGRRQASQPRHA